MKNKKGVSIVEYCLIVIITAVAFAVVFDQIHGSNSLSTLFKYTFDFKSETNTAGIGNTINISPMTD